MPYKDSDAWRDYNRRYRERILRYKERRRSAFRGRCWRGEL